MPSSSSDKFKMDLIGGPWRRWGTLQDTGQCVFQFRGKIYLYKCMGLQRHDDIIPFVFLYCFSQLSWGHCQKSLKEAYRNVESLKGGG